MSLDFGPLRSDHSIIRYAPSSGSVIQQQDLFYPNYEMGIDYVPRNDVIYDNSAYFMPSKDVQGIYGNNAYASAEHYSSMMSYNYGGCQNTSMSHLLHNDAVTSSKDNSKQLVIGLNGKPKRRRVASMAQRRAANIRERRRMFNLNEAFDELRTKVPTFQYEKRLSRIETLRLAITYISFMTEILNGKKPNDVKLITAKGQAYSFLLADNDNESRFDKLAPSPISSDDDSLIEPI